MALLGSPFYFSKNATTFLRSRVKFHVNLSTHSYYLQLFEVDVSVFFFYEYFKQAEDFIKINAAFTENRRPIRNRRRSTLLDGFIVTDSIGEQTDIKIKLKSIFFEIIDVSLIEFDHRFTENNHILLALSSSSEMNISELEPLKKVGIKQEFTTAKKKTV